MNSQKGVSIIIIFFVMVILLAVVMGLVLIVANMVHSARDVENAALAQFVAQDGVEKALLNGEPRPSGFCTTFCTTCKTDINDPNGDPATHCNNCAITNNSSAGCQVSFQTTYANGALQSVTALVQPRSNFVTRVSDTEVTIASKAVVNKVTRQANYVKIYPFSQ